MRIVSPAFRRYVQLAEDGHAQLWRLLVGIVLVVLVWGAATVVTFTGGAYLGGFAPGGAAHADAWPVVSAFFATPAGVATALASFVGLCAGVFLAVRAVHGRPAATVLGAGRRLSWRGFVRGLAASLLASGLAEAATILVDPSIERSAVGLGAWLLMFVPLAVLLFVQVSAEELAFRGYLVQSLAARFRSPLVWAVLPALLFTLLHWDSQSAPPMKAAMLLSIGAFAASATILLVRTGNLGAGIGAHLGLNMIGILFVSHVSWLSGAALYRSRPLDTGAWSGLDAALVGGFGIASFALMLLLLLDRRSPLRVDEA